MLLSTPVASLGREHLSVEDDVESDDDTDLPPLIPLDAEHHSPLTLLA